MPSGDLDVSRGMVIHIPWDTEFGPRCIPTLVVSADMLLQLEPNDQFQDAALDPRMGESWWFGVHTPEFCDNGDSYLSDDATVLNFVE